MKDFSLPPQILQVGGALLGDKKAHPQLIMFSGNPLASGTVKTLTRCSSIPGLWYAEEIILTSEAPGQHFCMSVYY